MATVLKQKWQFLLPKINIIMTILLNWSEVYSWRRWKHAISSTSLSSYDRTLFYIWAAPCKNASLGICGQRRPWSAQADQGLRCPQTELLYTIDCSDGKQMLGLDFAHVQDNVNPHILRMFEGTLTHSTAHILYNPKSAKGPEYF